MRLELEINGVSYPCSQTMGAMVRFKEETGKEITEMNVGSFTELVTYLYCCIQSACNREKKEFNYSLIDFADSVTAEDIAKWRAMIMSAVDVVSEKDTKKKKKASKK